MHVATRVWANNLFEELECHQLCVHRVRHCFPWGNCVHVWRHGLRRFTWSVRWPRRTNGVLGQKLRHVRATNMACRGKLRRVGATITSCRGKLRHVEAIYVLSRQITACQGQITSCQGKLRRVGAIYVVSRQITASSMPTNFSWQ